jgi:hypothetical protein
MKIFSIARRLLNGRRLSPTREQNRTPPCDPLDHPELKNMSLRELADLPFNRSRCCGPPQG